MQYTRILHRKKYIIWSSYFKNDEKKFFQLFVLYRTLTTLKSCVYRHTVILNSFIPHKSITVLTFKCLHAWNRLHPSIRVSSVVSKKIYILRSCLPCCSTVTDKHNGEILILHLLWKWPKVWLVSYACLARVRTLYAIC